MLGCKTEDTTTANTCGECNTGYTLASGACTASSSTDSTGGNNGSGDGNNSFGLHYSLLLGLFVFLF